MPRIPMGLLKNIAKLSPKSLSAIKAASPKAGSTSLGMPSQKSIIAKKLMEANRANLQNAMKAGINAGTNSRLSNLILDLQTGKIPADAVLGRVGAPTALRGRSAFADQILALNRQNTANLRNAARNVGNSGISRLLERLNPNSSGNMLRRAIRTANKARGVDFPTEVMRVQLPDGRIVPMLHEDPGTFYNISDRALRRARISKVLGKGSVTIEGFKGGLGAGETYTPAKNRELFRRTPHGFGREWDAHAKPGSVFTYEGSSPFANRPLDVYENMADYRKYHVNFPGQSEIPYEVKPGQNPFDPNFYNFAVPQGQGLVNPRIYKGLSHATWNIPGVVSKTSW